MIVHLFTQYFSYSVLNSIELLRDTHTPFPAVTICDHDVFNTPEGTAYINDVLKHFNSSKYETPHLSKIKLNELRKKFAKSQLLKNLTIYNDGDLRKKFSLTLDQILIGCNFGYENCYTSDFEYFFDLHYGNCYRFNSGLNSSNQKIPVKSVLTSGDKNGLQISLYLGAQNESNELVHSTGVHIEINNQSFRVLKPNNGFNVPTGAITSIGILFHLENNQQNKKLNYYFLKV